MKTSFLYSFVLILLWISASTTLIAQTDTLFWFVAPETTRDHGKEPGVINVTAYEHDAHVIISMPANPAFKPIYLSVPANTQRKHEFWDVVVSRSDNSIAYEQMLWTIENGTMDDLNDPEYYFPNDWLGWSPGTPFNKGLLIESDQPVSVSYSVASRNNPEIFNLKGKNALGLEFLIPSQNIYRNYPSTPNAREKADIVATEDNTIITIELTGNHNIEGHVTSSTFTITLDRGQTYSLRSTSPYAEHHLGGIFIVSNKPIAITISDDSIAPTNNIPVWDLVGDQLLPISNLGTKYIAMNPLHNVSPTNGFKYYPFNTDQMVFIWAAEAGGTQVYINGYPLNATLERGEFAMVNISDNAILIETSALVYVYQFTGVWYELGSTILPPLNCTGNEKVNLMNHNNPYIDDFLIQILTQKKSINYLRMVVNHQRFRLDELNWVPVDGTGNPDDDDTWYTLVQKQLPPYNESLTILLDEDQGPHDGLFHVSTVASDLRSCTYSYYASYNNLSIQGPTMACQGSEVTLFTNQVGKELMWFHESNPFEPFAISETVTVKEPGEYWIEINTSTCISKKSIYLDISSPEFEMPDNQSLCPGDKLNLGYSHFVNGETFEWKLNGEVYGSSNSFNVTIESDNQYEIELMVTDKKGCSTYDNTSVIAMPAPLIYLHDIEVNFGEPYTYVVDDAFHSYYWENITNDEEIIPENPLAPHIVTLLEPAKIALTVTNEHACAAKDSCLFTWGISTSLDATTKNYSTNVLQIHPNPTKKEIIHFSKRISGCLYRIDGRLITEFNETEHLNMTGIKPGVYVIHSNCGQAVRLVKQ